MASNKIDSNVVGLAIAEEASLKTLPTTPVWYALEPNSFPDFGGNFTNVARNPINANRSNKKGVLTDLEATGGYNTDFTQSNTQRLLQGFFFADAREKPTTQPFNSAAIAITGVVGSTKTFSAASGLGVFLPKHLILTSGFSKAANNGLDVIASVTGGTAIVGTDTAADEPAPPATAKIEVVGVEFASADTSIVAAASGVSLTSIVFDFTTLGLTIGEWVFLGGDATTNKFVNNAPGYARIASIAAHEIVFDDTTFVPVSETGTGKLIRMFFGKVIKNEQAALIKRRSYNIERQLGSDGVGTQSEYLEGAIPNELTLNLPTSGKIEADLSFVAMDYTTRNGTVGVKSGTRVIVTNEDAYNTSSDVYRTKLAIFDPTSINASPLFAFVTDAKLTINNGVTANKALGILGAFDASAGNFAVTGSVTAYFSTVEAVSAIRNNSDVAYNAIFAHNNMGFIFDMPLMSLGNGRLKVEKDAPITLPIDMNAAESAAGHTLLSNFFAYLPTVAMPV